MQEEVNAVEAQEAEASSKNSTQRLELKMLVAIGTLLCSLGATLAIISGSKAIPVPVKSDFPALSGLSPAIRDAVKSAKFDEALNLLSSVEPKNIDCEHLSYWETKLFCLYNTRDPLFEPLAERFITSCPDADYPRLIFARWMIRETSDNRPSWTNRKNTITHLDAAIGRVSGIIDRYEALTQKGLSSLQARTLLDSHDLAGQLYMLKWRYSWNPGLEPNEDRANAENHFQRGNSQELSAEKQTFLVHAAEWILEYCNWGFPGLGKTQVLNGKTYRSKRELQKKLEGWYQKQVQMRSMLNAEWEK